MRLQSQAVISIRAELRRNIYKGRGRQTRLQGKSWAGMCLRADTEEVALAGAGSHSCCLRSWGSRDWGVGFRTLGIR